MGGDNVTASAVGEMLDETGVRIGDDNNGKRRCYPQRDTEVGVPLECGKSFRRPVRRGGKAVCTESDPREDRDEGEFVKEGRVPDFLGGVRTGSPGYDATILAACFPVSRYPPAGYSVR